MLTRDEMINLASKLFGISYEEAKDNCSNINDGEALYFSIPVKGGASLIVGNDGQVLYADSSVGYTKHVEEYNNGRRTPLDAFNVE